MSLKLERKVGLVEGIGLVVGGVVGMGVYSMIPSIAKNAGDLTWIALSVAIIVSLIGVIPLVQISSALPAAGGGYLYCSRLIHPMVGLIVSFLAIVGGGSSVCVVTVGLAEFINFYLDSNISLNLVAMGIISSFYILYQFGLKLVVWLQLLMSAVLIGSLVLYSVGIPFFSESVTEIVNYSSPNMPLAIILAMNVCLGFQIIVELGEEIKNARKNIPLSLVFGGIIVLIIYIAVAIPYVKIAGGVGSEFHSKYAAVLETAVITMPASMVFFILLGAISAGLTSLNAGAIALPREILAQARDNMIPQYFNKINNRTKTPLRAVTLFFASILLILACGYMLEIAGLLTEFSKIIDFYGMMAACGIMFLTVFVSIAAIRLPKKYAGLYEKSFFRIPKLPLYLSVVVAIISSVVLLVLIFGEAKLILLIYSLLIVIVIIYYFVRKKWVTSQGKSMGDLYNPFESSEETN